MSLVLWLRILYPFKKLKKTKKKKKGFLGQPFASQSMMDDLFHTQGGGLYNTCTIHTDNYKQIDSSLFIQI